MVAINTLLEINLWGEISIERIGYRYFSGIGGQVEFHIGALLARNGRGIHGMISRRYSQTRKEWVSSIVPQFAQPGCATIPRNLADIVVTEYGVAKLLGRWRGSGLASS